jgi:alkylation response protein AidB-like acyl-CoA dehydrogenase
MDFAFTEEQVLLRDTARLMLANECPPSLVRAHIDDPSVADGLWTHLRDFAALGVGPCTDLAIFCEELGYVAAPGVFFATVALFIPFTFALGTGEAAAAIDGLETGTVALAGTNGEWVANADPVKAFVPEADRVDWIVVVDGGPEPRLGVFPQDAFEILPVQTVDFSRRLFEVRAREDTSAGGSWHSISPEDIRKHLERATVALAAEMVGTARRMTDMSVAYAKERYQFGVPIGSFQAIQHKLADVSLAVERAQSAVQYAAMAIDAGDPDRHRAVHTAKAAAGVAATTAARESEQHWKGSDAKI